MMVLNNLRSIPTLVKVKLTLKDSQKIVAERTEVGTDKPFTGYVCTIRDQKVYVDSQNFVVEIPDCEDFLNLLNEVIKINEITKIEKLC